MAVVPSGQRRRRVPCREYPDVPAAVELFFRRTGWLTNQNGVRLSIGFAQVNSLMTDNPSAVDTAELSRDPRGNRRGTPKRTWLLWSVIAIVVLVAGGFLIREFGEPKTKAAASSDVPVSTVQVTLGNIDVFLDALGTVTPVYTVTLASRVAGELTEIHYKEGQVVKKNELMAVIDPRPYRAALVQAQGQLERDQSSLKNARLDLTRYENSFKERAISQQQLATQREQFTQQLFEAQQETSKVRCWGGHEAFPHKRGTMTWLAGRCIYRMCGSCPIWSSSALTGSVPTRAGQGGEGGGEGQQGGRHSGCPEDAEHHHERARRDDRGAARRRPVRLSLSHSSGSS